MNSNEKLSVKILKRVIFVGIIVIGLFTVGVLANRSDVNYVTIVFPEDTESVVLTSNVKVGDILAESHIIVLPDEDVYPAVDSNIDVTKTITISKKSEQKVVVAEDVASVTTEEILGKYVTITEKIIIEQVEIPYETVTKDVSQEGTETKDTVLQEGKNGLKEIKYKVKYQDDVEVDRQVISETVVREPVEKIIQISTKIVSRGARTPYSAAALEASTGGAAPRVVTMNASAYCSCAQCCGKSNGITSSGTQAKAWYTLAAGPGYPIGTVIYIPALAGSPNGGWFVVEDRGGAISNNRIDVFMGSHSEALRFGRKTLECYIY